MFFAGAGEAKTKGSYQGLARFLCRGCKASTKASLQGVQGVTWWAWEGNFGSALYPVLASSRGGMFYQRPNDDKEIATEWGGLIKDPQRDNPLVSRHTRRLQKSPSLT